MKKGTHYYYHNGALALKYHYDVNKRCSIAPLSQNGAIDDPCLVPNVLVNLFH